MSSSLLVTRILESRAAVDELHDTNDLSDATWAALGLTDEQRLDLLLLAGWYHAISFVARAARVPLETDAPRFADYGAER